jgi:hypothetical protein
MTTLLPASVTPGEAQAAATVPAQRDRPGGMPSGLTVMAEGRLRVRLYRYMVFSRLQTGLPTRPPFRAGLPSPAARAGCVQTAQQVTIPVLTPMLGAAGPQSAHIEIFQAVESPATFNRRIGPALALSSLQFWLVHTNTLGCSPDQPVSCEMRQVAATMLSLARAAEPLAATGLLPFRHTVQKAAVSWVGVPLAMWQWRPVEGAGAFPLTPAPHLALPAGTLGQRLPFQWQQRRGVAVWVLLL